MKQADDYKQELETLRGRLPMLREAVLRINENLNFDDLLQDVVESARALTDARYGVITILTEWNGLSRSGAKQDATVRAVTGYNGSCCFWELYRILAKALGKFGKACYICNIEGLEN